MVSFDATQLPEIEDWEVGGTYMLLLEVEQTGVSKDMFDEEPELRATFKVLSVKAVEDDEPKKALKKFAKKIKKETKETDA